jgi:hypothetical protein
MVSVMESRSAWRGQTAKGRKRQRLAKRATTTWEETKTICTSRVMTVTMGTSVKDRVMPVVKDTTETASEVGKRRLESSTEGRRT